MTNSVRFAIVLGSISVAAAIGITGVHELTRSRIDQRRQKAFEESLKAVFPDAERFVPAAGTQSSWSKSGQAQFVADLHAGRAVAAATKGGQTIGYLAVGSRQGYSSRISVLVGVTPDWKIRAVRVLDAAETPGLGERIREVSLKRTVWQALRDALKGAGSAPSERREPWFQAQFVNKTIGQLEVVKGGAADKIQAITAATVSSKAVTEAARSAISAMERWTSGVGAVGQIQVITSATVSPGDLPEQLPGIQSSAEQGRK